MPAPDEFLQRLVTHARGLARAPGATLDYAPLRLGAFLYAGAEWLREERHSNDHQLSPPIFPSIDLAIAALRALPDGRDPYLAFVGALLAIEADLLAPGRATNLPASTALPGGDLPLHGEVLHRLRPASGWRDAQGRRRSQPGPMTYHRAPRDHLARLVMEWHPPRRVKIDPGEGARARTLVRRTREAWDGAGFRVALCALQGVAGPRFRLDAEGSRFCACPEDAPVGAEQLERMFVAARREGVALLLLPELHLREEELVVVRRQLASPGPLVAVAAGSGHVWASGASRPRNAAPLLGTGGGAVWTHEKRGLFRLTRKQLEGARGWFRDLPATFEGEVVEGIDGGEALTVLDTGIGRVAVVVCADLLDPEEGFAEAVREARPAFVLVVSMSPETDRFERKAEELAQLGISTLYVNATPKADTLSGFAWLALNGSDQHPPTRVRWWRDGRLEGWRPSGWSALPEGALARNVEELGLLVDLHAICEEP